MWLQYAGCTMYLGQTKHILDLEQTKYRHSTNLVTLRSHGSQGTVTNGKRYIKPKNRHGSWKTIVWMSETSTQFELIDV